jgi:hypothetical protein
MQINRPNDQEPTPEEIQELERVKVLIDQAIADGKITYAEVERLRNFALSNHKNNPEQLYRAIRLYRRLISDKLTNGELLYEFE